jgi:hypothetical protein
MIITSQTYATNNGTRIDTETFPASIERASKNLRTGKIGHTARTGARAWGTRSGGVSEDLPHGSGFRHTS